MCRHEDLYTQCLHLTQSMDNLKNNFNHEFTQK